MRNKGPLGREVVGSLMDAWLPGLGPVLRRLVGLVSDEWARNASTSIRAAEQISGMSREDIAEALEDDPKLIPLVTRLLFAAGQTGHDEILLGMGVALGDALRSRDRIDDAELVLMGIQHLRPQHIRVLRSLSPIGESMGPASSLPEEGDPVWHMCIAGLIAAGLVQPVALWGGTGVVRTPLSDHVLAAIDDLRCSSADRSDRQSDSE